MLFLVGVLEVVVLDGGGNVWAGVGVKLELELKAGVGLGAARRGAENERSIPFPLLVLRGCAKQITGRVGRIQGRAPWDIYWER